MRYKMADDIIDSDVLIGKHKDDIIELLGSPYDTNRYGKDNFSYRLGRPPSFSEPKRIILIIDFELNHAVRVIESSE
jgi:outer membrane protein assembly factor BamE (lipoprotein component of BamABCDE complex)